MNEQTIDLSKLTDEQMTQIRAQLKAQRATLADGRAERYTIIDRMLVEKDDTGFKNTTADIRAALVTAKLIPAHQQNPEDMKEWLKKIQTRKQHLEKETNDDGTLKYAKGTFGYKLSAGGFTLTPDRVIDWLMDEGNLARLSAADRKAILKAVKE